MELAGCKKHYTIVSRLDVTVGGLNTTTAGNASSTTTATTLNSAIAVTTASGVVVSASGLATLLTAAILVKSILL